MTLFLGELISWSVQIPCYCEDISKFGKIEECFLFFKFLGKFCNKKWLEILQNKVKWLIFGSVYIVFHYLFPGSPPCFDQSNVK